MASNPLECDICCNTYNEDHCPRILPCSHTFCGPCIDELISIQKKECAICRKEFTANSAEDLMIIRDLLDAAKQLPSKHAGSKTSPRELKKPFLETTKLFLENIGKGITVCEEAEVEVIDRIESNNKMRGGLEGFIQMLEEINLSSKKACSSFSRDNKLLMDKLDIMKGKGKQMKDAEDKLEALTDFASAAHLLDDGEKVLHEVDEAANEIKQLLQETKDNMKQDTLKMKINLKNAMEVIERMTEEEQQKQEGGEQEGGEQEERDSVVNITVTDLLSPHGHLRLDAQRETFVVMTFKGKLRVAPVKIESNNQVSVSHLEEGVLPQRCFVIELECLMQGSPSLPRAFLDLAHESTHLGRVIIKVVEGIWGLNFLYMCAGGMGISYANSRVFDVIHMGKQSEYIVMGNFVSHGVRGTSTRAVLSSKEDWEREREKEIYKKIPWLAGEVRGNTSYEGASQFWIFTNDGIKINCSGCFLGMVEGGGLNVLREALKYWDITNVKVVNCGLIFPM